MRWIKYMTLVSKLSAIEGRKESLKGEQIHTAKLLQRGTINEDDFLSKSESYKVALRTLDHERWSALRHYVAA